jgi:hypothetical protein
MTLHYASGGSPSAGGFLPGADGFNLADVSTISQVNALPSGVMGLVWLNETSGVTQSFIDKVTPLLNNSKVFGFYLADEPDPTGNFGPQVLASNLKAESDWIHTNFPGAKTFITMMNLGSAANPSYAHSYNWNNTHIDLYGISGYPIWSDTLSNPDYNVIDRKYNAAVSSGISSSQIVPVYQAFGGGTYVTEDGSKYVAPTAAQEQIILAHWAKLDPNPTFDYAYAWGQQRGDTALSALPDLQTVFLAHNSAPCYCTGTRILSARGDVAIEDLVTGDMLATVSGEHRPIRWIGHRRVDAARHPDPRAIWPVRVSAGAFGQRLPSRDLWMSPGHNLLVGSVLIPVRALVNGATVVQVPVGSVTYWHVELDSHDVILAEGLPAESYLDTGNRTAFESGGAFLELYPNFEPRHEMDTCAPIRKAGAEVEAARASLLARAEELGYRTTAEPDIHVLANGRRIEPIALGDKRFAFYVPPGHKEIALVSRSFVPCHTDPRSRDSRTIGVSVKSLRVDGEAVDLRTLDAAGWHDLEIRPKHVQRWTNGAAALPSGACTLSVDLAGDGRYWDPRRSPQRENSAWHLSQSSLGPRSR